MGGEVEAPEAGGGGDGPGGRGASDAEPSAPHDPGLREHRQAAAILEEVEAWARSLAETLAPPPDRALPMSSRSRGRFDYGRHYQGSERPFRQRLCPRPARVEVRLLHDLSGSMGDARARGSKQFVSVRAAMMLHRACELAGVPFTHHGFTSGEPVLVSAPGMDPEQGRAAIAALDSNGGTLLAPSLERAVRECGRETILFVLCDGMLSERDSLQCAALAKRFRGLAVPLLIGSAVEAAPEFKRIFGRAQAVNDVALLPRVVKTYLEAVAPVTS